MDKREVAKKDDKELNRIRNDKTEISKQESNDKIKKEIKKNTSSVFDSQNEIQVIKEKVNKNTQRSYKNKVEKKTKVLDSEKKEAYVNYRSNATDKKTNKKRKDVGTKILSNNKEGQNKDKKHIDINNKISKLKQDIKNTKVIKKIDKDNKDIQDKKNNNNKKKININNEVNKHNKINKSNKEETTKKENNENKTVKSSYFIQNKDNKEKVTDFKDVQKAAIAIEKKKKKQERIDYLNYRIEQLNTPRAKAGILCVLALIVVLTFGALTIINDVQVDEGKHYTEDEIKKFVIKNIFDYNSVYLFLKYRYSEQEAVPFVEYIDVDWIDKNTVRLKVYDKNIIGCTNFMNEYVYFDKDGFVVETSAKKENNIPYITGINFEELTLNSRIQVDDEEIFETILSITQQVSKYKLDIDEINFDNNYNLTMYAKDITVLLGKQATYDEQLAKLKSMLEQAKKENLSGVLHMEKYKEGQERIIFDKK